MEPGRLLHHEQAQAGGTVKITLQDLRTVGDRETASQVLAEGTWNLKFQLNHHVVPRTGIEPVRISRFEGF